MRPDIHALTGAYAANALSEHERAQFERHLRECPTCAQEVRELQETAGLLGEAVAAPPPAHLRDRVLNAISTVRQLPPVAAERPMRRRPRAGRLVQVAASVLLVAVLAALGALVIRQQNDIERLEASNDDLIAVLTAPDARTVVGGDTGGRAAVILSEARGQAIFTASGLDRPDEDQVYQLWAIGPGGAESAGLLATRPDGTTEPVVARLGNAESLGVTIEPAGGSTAPTSDPVLLVDLSEG